MRPLISVLAAAALLLTLPGCWLVGQMNQARDADVHFRNDGVRVNLRTVGLALAMYARDNHGTYPPTAGWLMALSKGYYLPLNRLPPNPWAVLDENTQANVPGLGPLAPIGERPYEPAPGGTLLGKGEKPATSIYTPTTYGALLYSASPSGKACVLYGVGQEGDNAIVADSHLRGRATEPTPAPASAAPAPTITFAPRPAPGP
jgi:hypothetical protein